MATSQVSLLLVVIAMVMALALPSKVEGVTVTIHNNFTNYELVVLCHSHLGSILREILWLRMVGSTRLKLTPPQRKIGHV